jgi:competence protein ComEC
MKRPLVPITVLYAGGILWGEYFRAPLIPLLAGCIGLVLVAIVWRVLRTWLLYALFFLTGWAGMLMSSAVISPHDLRTLLGSEPQIATVRADLTDTPSMREHETVNRLTVRTLARAQVTAIQFKGRDWQPAKGGIAIGTSGALTNLFAGQQVEIQGVISLPKRALAEGLFDYREYLRRLGIYYQLQAESEKDWLIISSPSHRPLSDRFRDWGRQKLAAGLPKEDEALRLEWALTLGWKPALTEEVSEPFVRAATYHIFAVDGLRMAIVFGIFFGLLRVLSVPRALSGAILIPVIWFYVALTGWPASAIRATVMLTIVIAGWALRRPSDLINSLFAAAAIILVWQPQQLFQAGFQLSFFVVLALILIMPVLQDLMKRVFAPDPLLPVSLRRRWPGIIQVPARYFWAVLLTSFAAWIGSLPLVAYYFNIFTPVSTPANLLAVPICGLVLIANLSSLLLGGWFPAAAEIFNHAGWALMELIRVSSHWFAQIPIAYYYVAAPSWTTTALYYSLLIAISSGWLFATSGRFWKLALALALTMAWSYQMWRHAAATELTILPENGAAAIFLDAPGRASDILMDCGSANSFQAATKPFLRSRGVNRLDNVALTHGDSRHVGGTEALDEIFNPERIWISKAHFRSPAYRKALALFAERPDRIRTVGRDERVCAWVVLHPDPEDNFPQGENSALVLLSEAAMPRTLLLSDLGRAGQSALLERYPDLRADVLVSEIPTGTEPLSEALLDTVQPQVIVVTDSEYPASARANAKLRERLAKRNVPVLYTRFCGAVTIEATGKTWLVRTMSGEKIKGPLPPSPALRTVQTDPARH